MGELLDPIQPKEAGGAVNGVNAAKDRVHTLYVGGPGLRLDPKEIRLDVAQMVPRFLEKQLQGFVVFHLFPSPGQTSSKCRSRPINFSSRRRSSFAPRTRNRPPLGRSVLWQAMRTPMAEDDKERHEERSTSIAPWPAAASSAFCRGSTSSTPMFPSRPTEVTSPIVDVWIIVSSSSPSSFAYVRHRMQARERHPRAKSLPACRPNGPGAHPADNRPSRPTHLPDPRRSL